LDHPNYHTFHITALVRSEEKAEKLATLGIRSVVGSHSDAALVQPLAEASDVVVTAADADDLDAARAIIEGLKDRFRTTGKRSILIHTVSALKMFVSSYNSFKLPVLP
jgi:D-arabinose 1-dehydrogenase-like Zn-dependent alcohol dehydrogenase